MLLKPALFPSAAGWVKSTPGVMRRRYVKNGRICVRNDWKSGTRGLYSLKTKAETGVQDMGEEDIVNEKELAASSTLSMEGRTVLNKLVIPMASFCFMYDMKFKNILQERMLAVKEDMTGMIFFVLAVHHYNLVGNRNDALAIYDLFCMNDMRDIAKVLEDDLTSRAHGDVFCSTLQFFL